LTLLGIDIGGTKVAFAVGDEHGGLQHSARRLTRASGDPEHDVAGIIADARGLLDEAAIPLERISRIGISVPGPIDPRDGCVLDPPNLPGWRAVPIARLVREALGRPVRVENDANAAALAEWRFGAARGARDVVLLTMSTGVGGGIIAGGRLVRGANGHAGEWGHVPVEWNGEACGCGERGCLEAYVGGRSWAARLAALTPGDSRVHALAGSAEAARPEHVVQAAGEGDTFALAEMDRFNHYLARGIVAIGFSLAPEVVVLGTIAAAAGDALCLDPVRRLVGQRLWPRIARRLRIEPAALGSDGAALAGLCAAIDGEALAD
jgi:glucokinase